MANFLGGAMRALSRSPKTAKFVDTLNHADLPRGWSDDPEIQRMAFNAWLDMGTNSPFFRSFYRNSKLVDAEGRPLAFYHGSKNEGLDAIDPDASRLAREAGGGAAYAVTHPGMALTYLSRPSPRLEDPVYRSFGHAIDRSLLAGDSLVVPSVDGSRLNYVHLSANDLRRWPEAAAENTRNNILRDLAEIDWRRNLRDLSDAYAAARPGRHVSDEALREAASAHHAHRRFLEDNADELRIPDLDGVFSRQEMGKIYPVYVNAERPLVIEGRPGVNDWTQTGQMALDRSYLFPDELERLDAVPRNIRDVIRGYDTPEMLYPSVDFKSLPTDNLASHLRRHTDHDAMWSRGVHDGGGGAVPAADTIAVRSAGQIKAASGPVMGTFDPNQRSMFRGVLPYVMAGGAVAAPSSVEARLRERDLPVEEAWNPVESLALAPMGGFWLDAAMGLAPDLPEVPDEYYEAAQ